MKKSLSVGGLLIIVITLFVSYHLITMNQVSKALSKYGSRGDEVKQIQTKLKNWGYYNGSIDRSIWKWHTFSCKKISTKKWANCRWNSRYKNTTSNGNK